MFRGMMQVRSNDKKNEKCFFRAGIQISSWNFQPNYLDKLPKNRMTRSEKTTRDMRAMTAFSVLRFMRSSLSALNEYSSGIRLVGARKCGQRTVSKCAPHEILRHLIGFLSLDNLSEDENARRPWKWLVVELGQSEEFRGTGDFTGVGRNCKKFKFHENKCVLNGARLQKSGENFGISKNAQ